MNAARSALLFVAAPFLFGACTVVETSTSDAGADSSPGVDSTVGGDSGAPETSGVDSARDGSPDTYVDDGATTDSGTSSDSTTTIDSSPSDTGVGWDASSGHAPGSLDDTFGSGGLVTYDPTTSEDQAQAIVQQPDGKLVLAGHVSSATGTDYALARFDAAGNLDPTFGTGGLVTLDVDSYDFGEGVALQPDGKIVLVGYGSNAVMARFTADGALDTTFGSTGWFTVSLGSSNDRLRRVLVTSSGSIVATGITQTGPGAFDTTLVAFKADGTPDTTFGSAGKTGVFAGTNRMFSNAIVQQADGTFLLAGYSGTTFLLTRLASDGSVDSTFASSGLASVDVGGSATVWSLAVQSDGKIVVAGASGSTYSMTLVRFDTAGAADGSFGSSGVVLTTKSGIDAQAYGVAVQPDGKIVAGGFSGLATDGHFLLARYNADGSADTAFGPSGDGTVTTIFPAPNAGDFAVSLLRQPDGPIVLAGYRFLDSPSTGTANAAFAMARYWW